MTPVLVSPQETSTKEVILKCNFKRLVMTRPTNVGLSRSCPKPMSCAFNTSEPLPAPTLTAREIQILREWVMRDSKSDVATALFITSATVSTHVNRIRLKYAAIGRPANTKAALLARALQDGHIDLDEL
ncbi:MAG: LuxR family transcriptional regulator [Gordonia sp.]|nr:LuxR family transcriptional regulator [Gordonia sp. (in: high G+C Gram-positive bacteria)]